MRKISNLKKALGGTLFVGSLLFVSCKEEASVAPSSSVEVDETLYFDGQNDQVKIPSPWGTESIDEFTIEFKFLSQLTSTCGSGKHERIISTRNRFEIAECGGAIRVYDGSTWREYGGAVRDSSWHSLSVVKSTTEIQVYLDGAFLGENELTKSYAFQDSISFGGNGGTESFEGYLDEVKFWSIALDSASVVNTMESSLSGSEAGLVAYYPINDPVDDVKVTDKTSNQFHGKLLKELDIIGD